MKAVALYNGVPAPAGDWTAARGLHYGDGVFRTLRIHAGTCLDWAGQRTQLLSDAARLRLRPDAGVLAALDAEAAELARDHVEGVLKLLLWRQAGERGYAPCSEQVERLLIRGAPPSHPARCWSEGVAVIHSPVRLATPHPLAGVKHLNRLEQVLASRDWPDDVHEALTCDAQDHLVSGTRSNLFWVEDGRLRTPPVDRCGVSGRMRTRVMELAQGLGLQVEEIRAPRTALDAAEEIFLTNSLIGIWPVRRLDARELPAPGATTRRLMRQLDHPECS